MKPQPPLHLKNNVAAEMTKDEFRKIEKAMKKPEFMGMLNDYMLEISDPKNKDEYDEYLKQLQKEGDLPKGLKLIKPLAEFVIKTTIHSKKDKGSSQKLFINLCRINQIDIPSCDIVEKDGKQGQNWRLPFSAGKMRYDQDSKKEVCNTIDVAFHPYAFQLAKVNPQFQQLLCQTALDGANQQMGERNETISKDYKVLQNLKCKGGTPALLAVRVSGKVNKTEMDKRQNGEGYEPSLYKDLVKQKQEHEVTQVEEQKKKEKKMEDIEAELNEQKKEVVYDKTQPIQAPKYKIVYSYPVNYEDFLDRREDQHLKRPIELTVEIKLPSVNNIKEINLDIEEKNLVLNVPNKYFLDTKLPYYVLQDEGNAKFDSKKQILRIKLPINKTKLPSDPVPPKTYSEFTQNEEQELEETIIKNKENKHQENENIETQEENKGNNQENIEPLLEMNNQKKVNLNFFNQQTNEAFIEGQINCENPVIEVLQEQAINSYQNEQEKKEDDQQEENEQMTNKNIQKKYKLLQYKTQETSDKVFIIYNIPGYDKEVTKHLIFENMLFFECPHLKNEMLYSMLEFKKPIVADECECTQVVDYIVFKIHKQNEDQYWEKDDISQIQEDYETYNLILEENQKLKNLQDELKNTQHKENNLDEIDEKQQQSQEKQINMKEEMEKEKEESEQYQQQQNSQNKMEEININNNQIKKEDFDNKEDDTQIIKLSQDGLQKNILQFLDFSNQIFAFELD